MINQRQTVCERCKKLVPVSEVKYLPKGKDSTMLICSSCRASINEKEEPTKKREEKVRYMCTRCSYKFNYNPSSISNLRCPTCGKGDRVKRCDELSTESLLRSVNDID